MKILVTGAMGFVGQNLTKLNHNFRCVVREGEKHSFSDSYVVSTINASTDWSDCFLGINAIIHLAGLAHSKSYADEDFRSVNTDGTLTLARRAAESGVKRFVFVSSIGVNGEASSGKPFSTHSAAKPHNSYALSKYEAELGLKEISKQTGLEVVIVRPTLVYGPEAPGSFGMLTKLISTLPFLPFGLANNRRDFIAVQNLTDLLIVCASHPDAAGHTFLVSDDETVSIKLFTNAIAESLGKRVLQLPIPVSLMKLAGRITGKSKMIDQLYGNLEVDSSNVTKVLGWKPPYSMKQAMANLRDSGDKSK